jgi:hypothetical protein
MNVWLSRRGRASQRHRAIERETNPYDVKPGEVRVGNLFSYSVDCRYCGREVGGRKRRVVRHDLEQHQRACTFR